MKREIRNAMRQRLLAMPAELAADKSRAACSALLELKEFRSARAIMIYLAIPGELDADEVAVAAWRDGKTVLVPKVRPEQRDMIAARIRSLATGLVAGSYGIREPAEDEVWPLEAIDLIVVPALAFDRSGVRLGRGGGFYDRFLAHPQVEAVKCGLAFDEQLVEALPADAHDWPVDMLVTDKEVLRLPDPHIRRRTAER